MKDSVKLKCGFCLKVCKNKNSLAQHQIRCSKNPDKLPSTLPQRPITSWNKGLTKETDERVRANGEKISKALIGRKGTPRTDEEKEHLSKIAVKRGLGGFNMRNKRILYKGVLLDSSYEVVVAESLDFNNIKWERPKRFSYYVKDKKRYYTPDFYLPEYNIYLDPKNDFLINNVNPSLGITDVEKIESVMKTHNIKILVLDKNNLEWDQIKLLI